MEQYTNYQNIDVYFSSGMSDVSMFTSNVYGMIIADNFHKLGVNNRIWLNIPLTVEMISEFIVNSGFFNSIAVSIAAIDYAVNSPNEPEKCFNDYLNETREFIQKWGAAFVTRIYNSGAPVIGDLFVLPYNNGCDGDLLEKYELAVQYTVHKFNDVLEYFKECTPQLSNYTSIAIIEEIESMVDLSGFEY